jgi:predicted metalloendopeptidase
VSWSAYKKFENKYGTQNSTFVDGLSNDQLFFVYYAQSWCIDKDKISEFDPHSPPRARVVGAIMNSGAFARSFNCPVGSRMNPTNKCAIWEDPTPPSILSLSTPQQTLRAQFCVIVLSLLAFLYAPL